MVLALLGVVLLLAGGSAWSWPETSATALRFTGPLLALLGARLLGGTGAAGLALLFVALGMWLHVGIVEATAGLAFFAAAVAILGGATPRIVVGFWLVGAGYLIVRLIAARTWRRLRASSSLTAERPPLPSLHPDN